MGRDGGSNHSLGPMLCVGSGISASKAGTVGPGVMGTRFPGKGCPARGLAAPLMKAGSVGQAAPGQTSLKSPVRSARVGTSVVEKKPEAGVTSRRHSSDQKKNVFCLSVL